jgi:uncharacterized membrane protein
MTDQISVPPVRILRHPFHPILWHFATACFVGTLLTDVTYWQTAEMMWTDFSAWLLTAGLIVGLLAAIVCLVDFLSGRLVDPFRPSWAYVIGNALALILALFNAFVHSRDAWTSVVPTGLILSAATVVILIVTGLINRSIIYRGRMRGIE